MTVFCLKQTKNFNCYHAIKKFPSAFHENANHQFRKWGLTSNISFLSKCYKLISDRPY